MGKRTARPSEAERMEAIGPDEVVSECPYNRRGALRFMVRRADGMHHRIAGARIRIDGPGGPQTCTTNAMGEADFVNQTQGAFTWSADYAAAGLDMLVEDAETGATSVIGGKRRIIPLYVQQLGSLTVEVRRDEGGRQGALLDAAQVLSISAAGLRAEGCARTDPVRGRPGRYPVEVSVAAPAWTLARQDMTATVTGGEHAVFVVRAVERTWLRAQVWDVVGGPAGTGAWLAGAEVRATANGEALALVTRGANDAAHWAPKPLRRYAIDAVHTPDRADEDDLYMFEELA